MRPPAAAAKSPPRPPASATPSLHRVPDQSMTTDFSASPEAEAPEPRRLEPGGVPPDLVMRWDLDKTYLATEFESLRSLLRIPFESADSKRSIPGARTLIRCLQDEARAEGRRVANYFVTASPPQLRGPIEEKLRNDGIVWDGIVYKDQVRDLLRGRFHTLKHHVGYKLGALLRHRGGLAETDTPEILFGDDWEQDPLVYTLYADLLASSLSPRISRAALHLSHVEHEQINRLLELARKVERPQPVVRKIFIHLTHPHRKAADLAPYGPRLIGTSSYLQTAIMLHREAYLSETGMLSVAQSLGEHHRWSREMAQTSIRNLRERDLIGEDEAHALYALIAPVIARMPPASPAPLELPAGTPGPSEASEPAPAFRSEPSFREAPTPSAAGADERPRTPPAPGGEVSTDLSTPADGGGASGPSEADAAGPNGPAGFPPDAAPGPHANEESGREAERERSLVSRGAGSGATLIADSSTPAFRRWAIRIRLAWDRLLLRLTRSALLRAGWRPPQPSSPEVHAPPPLPPIDYLEILTGLLDPRPEHSSDPSEGSAGSVPPEAPGSSRRRRHRKHRPTPKSSRSRPPRSEP